MLTSILAIAIAAAAPTVSEGGNASYTLSDSASALNARTEAALEATLAPMNFAVQLIAEGRLAAALTTCSRYTFTTADAQVQVQCDNKTPINGSRTGGTTPFTNDKGTTFSVTIKESADRVVFTFTGEEATQITTYRFTDDGMIVSKVISNAHLEVPLRWDTNYTRTDG
ncbi:MAG: hypothetical protein ACI8RZ_002624 [Myxococcota bacterium]|jgi:hypothetical protein